jgi:hypothetical protein
MISSALGGNMPPGEKFFFNEIWHSARAEAMKWRNQPVPTTATAHEAQLNPAD